MIGTTTELMRKYSIANEKLIFSRENKTRFVPKLIIIYFIIIQTLIIWLGVNFYEYRIFRIPLFNIGFILSLFLTLPFLAKILNKKAVDKVDATIKVILYYSIYQLVFILPATFITTGLSFRFLVEALLPRLYFLLIPFFLFYVLPYLREEKIIRWLNISTIVLVLLAQYNFFQGIYSYTNTGEYRIIAGISALVFTFSIITGFYFFSNNKSKLIYVIFAIIGLVFANHRTAYVGIVFIMLIALYFKMKDKGQRVYGVLSLIFFIILIVLITSNTPILRDTFFTRAASSFDIYDNTAQDRFINWIRAWFYFLENPLNGSMLENKFYLDQHMASYPPHNFIFELLATQGIIGFMFIAVILYKVIKIGFCNRRDNIIFQMTLMVIYYVFYSLFNVTFLNAWSILILTLSTAIILYRSKILLVDSN
jgi:O-antigen ligase